MITKRNLQNQINELKEDMEFTEEQRIIVMHIIKDIRKQLNQLKTERGGKQNDRKTH